MSLLRRDCIVQRGGVAIYCSPNISCREMADDELLLKGTLWCEVKMVIGEYCIVGLIYRAPSARESHNL